MAFLAQQTPPTDDIYDIVVLAPKDPVWPAYFAIVILALVLVAVGVLVWWWLRKSNRGNSPLSPEQRAEGRLGALRQQHGSLDPNKFALAVSETLKDYLGEKFDDPVRYETAQEFLQRVSRQRSRMPGAAQQELQQFLMLSEELKFGSTEGAEERTLPLLETAERIVGLCHAIGDDSAETS